MSLSLLDVPKTRTRTHNDTHTHLRIIVNYCNYFFSYVILQQFKSLSVDLWFFYFFLFPYNLV
jgi:hypothetical protein